MNISILILAGMMVIFKTQKRGMTQEELIKFLKDNLKIEFDINECWETKELCVKLYLGDEIISNEFISI